MPKPTADILHNVNYSEAKKTNENNHAFLLHYNGNDIM
jgi:hypothetical protein